MRVEDGKLVLGIADRRVGNFVYSVEEGHIVVGDIGGCFIHRVSRGSLKGRFLEYAIEDSADATLEMYACVMYNVIGCVPDAEFLMVLNEAANACYGRHPELYSVDPNISDEEDAEILEGVRETMETEREILEKEGVDES